MQLARGLSSHGSKFCAAPLRPSPQQDTVLLPPPQSTSRQHVSGADGLPSAVGRASESSQAYTHTSTEPELQELAAAEQGLYEDLDEESSEFEDSGVELLSSEDWEDESSAEHSMQETDGEQTYAEDGAPLPSQPAAPGVR